MRGHERVDVEPGTLPRVELTLGEGRAGGSLGRRAGSRRLPALLTLLLLALVGAAATFLVQRYRAALEPAPAAPATERAGPVAEPAPAPADTRPLPALDASDAFVRELVGRLSRHPQLAAWLASDELVRRFVAAVAALAEGRSPGLHVPFLRPAEPFTAVDLDDRLALDPASYRRYDLLAAVIDSLDVAGTAELYRRLAPLLDEAYRDLGFPEGRFVDAAEPALRRLESAAGLAEPAALTSGPAGYQFADPRLEELDAATKHLWRLGPTNLAVIQAKVAAIAAAAGLAR
jgi:hypothetical protein